MLLADTMESNKNSKRGWKKDILSYFANEHSKNEGTHKVYSIDTCTFLSYNFYCKTWNSKFIIFDILKIYCDDDDVPPDNEK